MNFFITSSLDVTDPRRISQLSVFCDVWLCFSQVTAQPFHEREVLSYRISKLIS